MILKLEKLIAFFPIIILISPYLIDGIRFDMILSLVLLLIVGYRRYQMEGKLPLDNLVLFLILLTFIGVISTAVFALAKETLRYVNFSSFTMLQYWLRISIFCLICSWASDLYRRNTASQSIKSFYLVSFSVALMGALETFRLIPIYYDQALSIFMPSSVSYMREQLLELPFRRATSILAHPSTFAYFTLFMYWISFRCQSSVSSIVSKKTGILIFVLAAFCSGSKLLFLMLPLILLYEYVIIRKHFTMFFFVVLSIVGFGGFCYWLAMDGGWSGTLIHKVYFFVWAISNLGIYEVFFRTRFDSESGLLTNSIETLLENPFFGIGVNVMPEVFYGDSAYLTMILRYGVIGLVVFLVVIHILRVRSEAIFRSNAPELIRVFAFGCSAALVMSVLTGFVIDSFSLFKISEIIYFYILYLSFGEQELARSRKASIVSGP